MILSGDFEGGDGGKIVGNLTWSANQVITHSDGSGYPDGLVDADIPLAARIMAVADVYGELRSKRPYKPAFTHEESVKIVLDGAKRHFDPAMVEAFVVVETEFAEIRRRLTGLSEN
jgi:HD-GYP domain-containing protein (c-di-GMP phosphodiesterase class II)